MGRKDQYVVTERQHPLVQAVEEMVGVTFGLIGKIRTANAFEEQCVTREDGIVAELIHGRAFRVTRHADRCHSQVDAWS